MRILLSTRGSAGHVLPLAPFGQAARRAGHDVLVVAQRQHAANVDRTGLSFALVDEAPPETWQPLLGSFSRLGIDVANAKVIGEYFARIDTAATPPAYGSWWRRGVPISSCARAGSTSEGACARR